MTASQKNGGPHENGGVERVEEFTDIIGDNGRYQIGIFIFCFFCSMPHCFHNLIMTFFAPNIDHWCARPPEILAANISLEQWKNMSIPIVTSRTGFDELSHCTMYKSTVRNGSLYAFKDTEPIKCNAWEYDHTFYQYTMVDEWDLVCEREWLVSISKTVYMVAFLFSATLCGQMSDRFGRRKTMIACLCIFLIASMLTLLSVNFIMFLSLRFFVALGLTSVFTISYVILTEIVSVKYRSIYCFTFKYGWVFAYMLMPYIAWHITSWFWLQLVFTLPWLSLLCIFWVVPETPRWLITHRKFTELEKVLMNAAEKNGKDMKQAKAAIHHFINNHPQLDEKKGNETVLDLLRTPALRRNTINVYFCWFIISYIYYALSWNTNDLGGDPYWTFFACGAVELPAGFIFMFICRYVGHRFGLLLANILAGLSLLAVIFVPPEMVWLTIFFSMSGKFFNSASFDTVYIYTAEIFPTVVRNVAVGSSSTWARIGALVAPFIRQVADVTHHSVPMAVPGGLSIISGFLMLLLPETLGKKVPDTLEEGERFAKKLDIHPPSKEKHNGVGNGIEMGER
ncbi:organic cation transporter protein [Trichonephila clavata]|uniref:Organic cation transporter protein n=1 Tax=Trichonephila clavata TaxID=2740835 RepID=A0A8X6FIE9_TRICU|nr:organic cation transporter protein [Trichonephila clavata]